MYDKEIVRRVASGDVVAFAQLYEDCVRPVYRRCFKQLRNETLSCEVVKKTFIDIFQNTCRLKDLRLFDEWVQHLVDSHAHTAQYDSERMSNVNLASVWRSIEEQLNIGVGAENRPADKVDGPDYGLAQPAGPAGYLPGARPEPYADAPYPEYPQQLAAQNVVYAQAAPVPVYSVNYPAQQPYATQPAPQDHPVQQPYAAQSAPQDYPVQQPYAAQPTQASAPEPQNAPQGEWNPILFPPEEKPSPEPLRPAQQPAVFKLNIEPSIYSDGQPYEGGDYAPPRRMQTRSDAYFEGERPKNSYGYGSYNYEDPYSHTEKPKARTSTVLIMVSVVLVITAFILLFGKSLF